MSGLIDYFRLLIHQRLYSKDKIIRYREKHLKKLYAYAVRKSPFYRELYQNKTFDSMESFYKLPLINKQVMMDHLSDLNTIGEEKKDLLQFALEAEKNQAYRGYFKDKYVVGLSSGTSGNVGIYITSKKLTQKLPFVFLARSGIPLSLLPFNILFFLRVNSQAFEDINAPFIKLQYMSTMTDIRRVVDQINERRINILMAPPSFLRQLLPIAGQIRKKPKLVMTYAEVLTVEDRELFKNKFGCKVIEIYQASEGQMASACKCGNLHINEDLVYIELYDQDGNEITDCSQIASKVIVTNLVNYAQPLIRYEMNDLIQLGGKCPCGSNFRTIDKIVGRSDDILYFYGRQNREIIHVFPDLFARWIITQNDNIREFRVVNTKINEIEVTIDLLKEQTGIDASLKNRLLDELLPFGIPCPKIDVKCASIELSPDKNKFKRFVRNFS